MRWKHKIKQVLIKPRFLSVLLVVVPFINVRAAVRILDFEDEVERACSPSVTNALITAGCVHSWATSGDWSFRFNPLPWKEGMNEWPSINLVPSVSDWSKYDRLVVDVVNTGADPSDSLGIFISRSDGPVTEGLHPQALLLPARGFVRWVVPLVNWPKKTPSTSVGRIHFFVKRPHSANVYFDSFVLLEKGEPVSPISSDFVRMATRRILAPQLESMLREYPQLANESKHIRDAFGTVSDNGGFGMLKDRIVELETKGRHSIAYKAFRDECRRSGLLSEGLLLGWATSMEKVLPRGARAPQALKREGICLRLSRNEREASQLLVAANGCDFSSVEVIPSDLVRDCEQALNRSQTADRFLKSNVTCSVMGYVKTRPPPYKVAVCVPTNVAPGYATKIVDPEIGWWPDPILSYLSETEVRGTDIQSFWIGVRCPRNQRSGLYRGKLKVIAKKAGSCECVNVEVPFAIRVNDFSLSDGAPLPLIITFAPDPSEESPTAEERARVNALRGDMGSPVRIWKRHEAEWREFLADYGFTVPDGLYHSRMDSPLPDFEALKKLKALGRRFKFNLGYWGYPVALTDESKATWCEATLPRIAKRYERAKREGLLGCAYIYGCDEVCAEHFRNVEWAVSELKRAFPCVPLMSTAYDDNYGVDSALSGIDWFTPTPDKFDVDMAARARAMGHQVWWYICCNPLPPYANMFIESRAIEGRLLMGAQTVRMKPDGFLYYQTAKWNAYRPITGRSAFTDWVARSWTTYNGDGSWLCCGPDGTPLTTIRLENFRDGLEDLAYAQILERKLSENPQASWATEARELLEVPCGLVEKMSNYADDPQVLYRWRDRMADLIEAKQ